MKSNFSYIKENLTTAELLALTNQLYGRQFLNETERVITILKNHESFLKKEHIFWEWMVKPVLKLNYICYISNIFRILCC